ncbi:MAG: DUF305 domain-containing protein [Longimicrobiales bacterium]|nr:DUF305 domain-containing protein [Longimicrobiales bacterium]
MRAILRLLTSGASSVLVAACASYGGGSGDGTPPATTAGDAASAAAPVIQPGAPGEASRVVEARRFEDLDLPPWTEADADFMSGMIHHHAQALQMTALIPERSASVGVSQMGLRMEISQRDEIRLMHDWLRERGLDAPEVVLTKGPDQGILRDGSPHATTNHAPGGLMPMPGMLSAEQMRALEAAHADRFDRLFLEFMIQHHTGALTMVERLFETPGAGQDSRVFQFATDVDADQRAEIDRMRMLLARYRDR